MKSLHLLVALFFSVSLIAQTPDAYTKIESDEVPNEVMETFMQLHPKPIEVKWGSFNDEFQAKHKHNEHIVYSRFNAEGLHRNDLTQMNWEKEASKKLKDSKNRSFYKHWDVIEFYQKESSTGDLSYTLQLKNEDNELGTIYFDSEGGLDEKSKSAY
jgi:hypothetical protein